MTEQERIKAIQLCHEIQMSIARVQEGFGGLMQAFRRLAADFEPKPVRKPPMCDDCGKNRSDPPSRLCPGCQAYQEHQR